MWVDLTDPAKIKITPGDNIQGAHRNTYILAPLVGTKDAPTIGSGPYLWCGRSLFPPALQGCITEIHGSGFDLSSSVMKYSGSLHEWAYPWMCDDAE